MNIRISCCLVARTTGHRALILAIREKVGADAREVSLVTIVACHMSDSTYAMTM